MSRRERLQKGDGLLEIGAEVRRRKGDMLVKETDYIRFGCGSGSHTTALQSRIGPDPPVLTQ
jgi:hypothetical protein